MPNWCVNELSVAGPKLGLDMFAKAIDLKDDGTYASLKDTFLPTPRELSFCTGGTTIDGTRYDAWYEHTVDGVAVYTPVTARAKTVFKKRYGADNWYDWNIKCWGCKWGDRDGRAERRPRSVFIEFETPWGPPEQGIETISTRFSALTFTLRYWECGMGFQGKTVFEDGIRVSDTQRHYSGPRGG